MTDSVVASIAAERNEWRARAERAEAALKPFAEEAKRYDPDDGDGEEWLWAASDGHLRIKHLREARDAIARPEGSAS